MGQSRLNCGLATRRDCGQREGTAGTARVCGVWQIWPNSSVSADLTCQRHPGLTERCASLRQRQGERNMLRDSERDNLLQKEKDKENVLWARLRMPV